jgi:hypothetical protein
MTLTPPASLVHAPTPVTAQGTQEKPAFAVRVVDISALRRDGSILIGQRRVPTLPAFDNAFCAIARGTAMQTPNGAVCVEDLQPGDTLLTANGNETEIHWIGSAKFAPPQEDNPMTLTRIMADSFGMNKPDSFISLGPAARLLKTPVNLRAVADGKVTMTPAHSFVDGVNVIDVSPPTSVQMFHIGVRKHSALLAAGLEVESYHPGIQPMQDMSYSMRSVFMSIFPHFESPGEFGPLMFTRADKAVSDQSAA